MVNRADLRLMVRRKLEDAGGSPLWDDSTLNDVLADAVAQHGVRFPAEETLSIAVSAGDTSVPVAVPAGIYRVVRVRDPNGDPVGPSRAETSNRFGVAQAWRWWNGALHLSTGAIGGNWEIDYLGRREVPDDDVTPVDVPDGDEEIVVTLAASGALMRRSVEQGKRGLERAGLALAKVAEMHTKEAERLIDSRKRRVAGGWIS